MARGYQRLEELDEKERPSTKTPATGKPARTDKAPSFLSLGVIVLLIVALGGALFYAARMRDNADAMKVSAENTRKETVAIHQQLQILEGERDSWKTKADTLAVQLKKVEDEKDKLLLEVEKLKKARTVPQKQDAKKSRKHA